MRAFPCSISRIPIVRNFLASAFAITSISGCPSDGDGGLAGLSGLLAGISERQRFDEAGSAPLADVDPSRSGAAANDPAMLPPGAAPNDPAPTPPVLQCPPNLVVDCAAGQGQVEIEAWLASAFVVSGCADVVVTNDFPGAISVPTITVTFTAQDSCGHAQCVSTLSIVNPAPPKIIIGEPLELWPPNHQYAELTLADCGVRLIDACVGELDVNEFGRVTAIYSDEPENGEGDGNTMFDIVLTGDSGLKVRRERQGGGNGRVYGVSFEARDLAGNVASGVCYVTVPHDQSGGAAVDDGPTAGYSVP